MKEQFQDKYNPVWPDAKGELAGQPVGKSIFENSCWLPMPEAKTGSENNKAKMVKVEVMV